MQSLAPVQAANKLELEPAYQIMLAKEYARYLKRAREIRKFDSLSNNEIFKKMLCEFAPHPALLETMRKAVKDAHARRS